MIHRLSADSSHSYEPHLAAWMMLLSLFLPACGTGQPPEKVAQLMVKAAQNKGASAFENLTNTPSEQLAAAVSEWSSALESTLGERPHAAITLQIVTKTGELYDDGKFQPKESSKYAARVRAVSRDLLASWQSSVNQSEGGVDGPNVLWFMVRQSAMFEGTSLRGQVADRQLNRLRGLPGDAVTRWAALIEASKGSALFSLIQVDPLFKDSEFQVGVFNAALPHSERLLRDGATEK